MIGWHPAGAGDQQLEFLWGDGTAVRTVNATTNTATGNWITHMISWDLENADIGFGLVAFYENGVLKGTRSTTGSKEYVEPSTGSFYMGKIGTGYGCFSGQIADLYVWPGLAIGLSSGGVVPSPEAEAFAAGVIPFIEHLKFWHDGQADVLSTFGGNLISHEDGGGEVASTTFQPNHWAYSGDIYWPFPDFARRDLRLSVHDGKELEIEKTGDMTTKFYDHIKSGDDFHLGVEIELPSGQILRSSDVAIPADDGAYPLTLKSWGDLASSFPDREFRTSAPTSTIVISDLDRELSKYFTGEGDGLIEGSPIKIKLITPKLSSDYWFTHFEGVIKKWEPDGVFPNIVFTYGPYDEPLLGNPNFGLITLARFPAANESVINQPLQAIYGSHKNVSVLNLFDEYGIVSVGNVVINRTYRDGVIDTTSYEGGQQTYLNNILFTTVEISGFYQSNVITVDVDGINVNDEYLTEIEHGFWAPGITERVSARGNPITNPAEIIAHALSNFYYSEYSNFNYSIEESGLPIEKESYSEACDYFARFGIKAKIILRGNVQGYQFINSMSNKFRLALNWSRSGKLQFILDEPNKLTTTPRRELIERENVLSPLKIITDPAAIATEINYSYSIDEKTHTKFAKDFTRSSKKIVSVDNDWSF
jgi:hypothetical protein